MPIRVTNIEYTESGVNMRGEEVEVLELADGTTKEFRKRGYAKALGINDFGGDRAAMLAEAERLSGKNIADLATTNVELIESIKSERQAKEQAIAERDAERKAKADAQNAVIKERAEKAELVTKLERANAERDQLLQQPPRQNDRGDAGRGE